MVEIRTRRDWVGELVRTGARRLSNPRDTIGYIGWTVGGNLGDEAMYEAALRLFDGTPVEVFSGARREAILANLGLSGPSRFSRVFLGGGTLINHGYLGVVHRAHSLGLPVSTLGTGVGSSGFGPADERVETSWRDALNAMQRVGVRGPRSAAKLHNLGVEKAEVVGDLALALTPAAPADLDTANGFILNAACPSDPSREAAASAAMFEALAAASRALFQVGLKPLPVAFCAEDVAPIRAVLERAGLDGYGIAKPPTADAFFDIARGARVAIGVRLHAAILSCCAGVPPLAIAYREKGYDFAESLGFTEIMVPPKDLDADAFGSQALEVARTPGSLGRALHSACLDWKGKLEAYINHA